MTACPGHGYVPPPSPWFERNLAVFRAEADLAYDFTDAHPFVFVDRYPLEQALNELRAIAAGECAGARAVLRENVNAIRADLGMPTVEQEDWEAAKAFVRRAIVALKPLTDAMRDLGKAARA